MTGTALAKAPSPLPPAEWISTTALTLPPNLPFAAWDDLLGRLRACASASSWWWGDALNYGEDAYNERYSQALEASDLAYSSLRNAAYVARHIGPERRRPELSFSHHETVAALDEADQELLLDQAVASGLSRNEMRELVKQYKANLDAEIKGKREATSVPPAVQEPDAGVPPAEPNPEPEIDWQAEYARTAQENEKLHERVNVLAATDEIAQQVARLHEQLSQALALVDERNAELRRVSEELEYRKRLLKSVMEALGVIRYNQIIEAVEDLRR